MPEFNFLIRRFPDWHMMRSSHLTTLSAALQYFLQRRHWNLGPGFISISPAKMIKIIKLVPFEGIFTLASVVPSMNSYRAAVFICR